MYSLLKSQVSFGCLEKREVLPKNNTNPKNEKPALAKKVAWLPIDSSPEGAMPEKIQKRFVPKQHPLEG